MDEWADFLPEGILLTDTDGRIKSANLKMCELIETSKAKLVGKTLEEIGLHSLREGFIFVKKTTAPYCGLFVKIKGRITGSEKTLEISISPVVRGEETSEFIILSRDITWFLKMEEEERINFGFKMVEESVRTLNHELRTHLMAIQGAVQLLTHSPADREMLNIIHEEVEKIKQLLDIFHPLTHPIPHKENVDLNKLCEESLKRFKPEIEKKKIKIKREYLPSLPLVYVDPFLVSRGIDNLIKNSLEAMTGGLLTVRTYLHHEHDIFPEKEAVILQIMDTGPGLPEEVKNALFLPVHSSKKGGTGLGLYITKKMISLNGGLIRHIPTPIGVCFEIAFPAT